MSSAQNTGDEGAAILLVIMLILVVGSLSIALLGSLLAQAKPISLSRKTQTTVNAAQAGFDAALSQIRAATRLVGGVRVVGDATKLPCYWTAGGIPPLAGAVDGTSGTATYSVSVTYYQFDPSNQLKVWQDDPTNQVSCTATGGASKTPAYALLVSTGSVNGATTSGNRTLTTTYQFSTNNTNVTGGPIHLYGSTQAAQTMCWDAGTQIPTTANPTPPSPWQLTINTCYSGSSAQSFQYRADYSIALGVTTTTATDGYCVTASAIVGNPLLLLPCDHNNTAGLRNRQQWGRDSGQAFYVTPTAGNNYYVSAGAKSSTVVVGATLNLQTSGGSDQNWTADSSTGAGNGGSPIGETANYSLFGSCFDVTGWNMNSVFMIAYPCKQPTPTSGAAPDQNQVLQYDSANKWLYMGTTSGSWSTTFRNTGNWCVVAPTTASNWVTMSPCSATATNQRWVPGDSTRYATAFTFVSNNGLCMAAGPIPPTSTPGYVPWPSITADTCTGDATQKWNATNNPVTAGLDNTQETVDGQ